MLLDQLRNSGVGQEAQRFGPGAADLAGPGGDDGGDPCIGLGRDIGRNLGAGLASLIYVLTPEAVILSGGISAGADLFLPTTQAEIERRVLPSSREGLQLLVAQLGNQAGVVGAARLALQSLGH